MYLISAPSSTYIRWGRNSCPKDNELVYKGIVCATRFKIYLRCVLHTWKKLIQFTTCGLCDRVITSSDTQGWFRSLHWPLGQLARKALNLLPKIDTKRYSVRSNLITALISKLFSLVILLIRKWGWNQWNNSIRSAVNRRKFN